MNLLNLKTTLFFALTVLIFSACELNEDILPDASTPELRKGGQTCTNGQVRYFSLQVFTPGQSNADADYGFGLNSINPYSLDDCLCHIQQYRLTFDALPDVPTTVSDNNGSELSFHTETDPVTGQQSIVVQADQIEDAAFAVYVAFDGGSHTTPQAGGLCIVDNIDGGDPQVPAYLTTPYWIYSNPPSGPLINEIWIPTAMTIPG
jgi:hypothetical protein